jgi:hypothetical protein
MAALASLPAIGRAESASGAVPDAVSPAKFGAVGDGVVDDTRAFQACLDASMASGGVVSVGAGQYRITGPLTVSRSQRFTLRGEGGASVLLHDFDGPLLTWPKEEPARHVLVADLAFVTTGAAKSPTTPVMAFPGGLTFGTFSNLMLDGGAPGMGSGVVVRGVTDTTTFANCVFWRIKGVGIQIEHGSEVRIIGGRITGVDTRQEGNIGVLLRGNNGGVHITETDLIHLHTGLQIGVPGGPSNREIFLTHVTFDSSLYGLRQLDHAYTSVIGCWAASCDEAQIAVEPSASGALLTVSGGTIFNGGIYGRPGSGNGIVVQAGSFSLSGSSVRFNKGTGILVGEAVRNYVVDGCRIHNNGTAGLLSGRGYQVTGNLLFQNAKGLVDQGKGPKRVSGNLTT